MGKPFQVAQMQQGRAQVCTRQADESQLVGQTSSLLGQFAQGIQALQAFVEFAHHGYQL